MAATRNLGLAILISIFAVIGSGQSGRVAPGTEPSKDATAGQTPKELYDQANAYIRTKAGEYEAKKIPFSQQLLELTMLDQRHLAARYAASVAARKDVAGDDLYFLGLLHWIAGNLDGARDALGKYLALPSPDAGRAQTARSVIVVSSAQRKDVASAEAMLAEYLKREPKKITERERMETELARAYQRANNFSAMLPHAVEGYADCKMMVADPATSVRGLDNLLGAGKLSFEAYRDNGDSDKALGELDDIRDVGARAGTPGIFYYAVDEKIRYLIDLGRHTDALSYYQASLIDAAKNISDADARGEVLSRLKKRETHYKLLGQPAPELASIKEWFPGERLTLAQFRGKVVLLDFWATWCGPCIEAFPSIREWGKDLGPDGLVVLGITRFYGTVAGLPDDQKSELAYLKRFRESHFLPYDILVAEDQSTQLVYGATALPTTVVIDRKGVVRYIDTGTSPQRLDEIHRVVLKLLAEK